jgi:putative hydrolase of HD superfamily
MFSFKKQSLAGGNLFSLSKQEATDLLSLFWETRKLKDLPRSGWFYKGIKNPESLADHSWQVAFIALVLAQYLITKKHLKVNLQKIVTLAIIHDLPELRTMDIPTPIASKYFGGRLKHEVEMKAFLDVFEDKGVDEVSVELFALWREFDERQTLEAKVVNCADKLDMMLQVLRYEELGCHNMDDFWEDGQEIFDKLGLPVFYEALRDLQNQTQKRNRVYVLFEGVVANALSNFRKHFR